MAWRGEAGRGLARHGKAWHGKAWMSLPVLQKQASNYMNITFYKKRMKKLKKMLESGKSRYSGRRLTDWIVNCRIKISRLRSSKIKNKPQLATKPTAKLRVK